MYKKMDWLKNLNMDSDESVKRKEETFTNMLECAKEDGKEMNKAGRTCREGMAKYGGEVKKVLQEGAEYLAAETH
jgi:hypothetical protein